MTIQNRLMLPAFPSTGDAIQGISLLTIMGRACGVLKRVVFSAYAIER